MLITIFCSCTGDEVTKSFVFTVWKWQH